MLAYSVHGSGDNRVLVVAGSSAHRFRFWQDAGSSIVQFKKSGGKLIASVTGKVMVYKKPNAHEFHRELMAANSRALWLGLQSDPDRLVDNMLEYVETI